MRSMTPGVGRVEGVPHVARRMVRRHVEQLEVVVVGLDIAGAVDLEAHLGQDGVDLRAASASPGAAGRGQPPAGERHVERSV